MNWRAGDKYFKWGITAFLVIISSICFYYVMFLGSNIKRNIASSIEILMPVVFGLVIAYLLSPILNFTEYRILRPLLSKCKIKESTHRNTFTRSVGILVTEFLFFALIYGLFSMLISQIVPSIINITNNFDTYVSNFTTWLNKLLEDNPSMREYAISSINKYSTELETFLNNTILQKSSMLIKTVSLSILSVIKILWNLIIGIIISIYVLANKEKFTGQAKKMAYAFFQKNTANIIVNNFHFTHNTFSGFISGKVLDSILIGCLCFVGTSFMDTPYAVLVSMIIGVTNIIPFFGPYLGAIPCAVLILLVDPMHPLNCIYFLIFLLILQQFDGNVLGPKILGNSTGLTGFWVIFAITFFGGLWGVFGMIVGVPLFAVLYAALRSYIYASLKKRNLPQETSKYISLCAIDEEGMHEYTPNYMVKRNETSNYSFGERFLSPMDETIKGRHMNGKEKNISKESENVETTKIKTLNSDYENSSEK